jgi:ATP-binding cassette, subfamily C (CFTR/MRP), member 1
MIFSKSLARAIYSRAEVLLLDNVFSGLDNTTKNYIFSRLLGPGGLLRNGSTAVVLTTHDCLTPRSSQSNVLKLF